MITTAGNGPDPSGFDSSTGICSEVPFGVVVVMDGPESADAHPATVRDSASGARRRHHDTSSISLAT
jgi:hypothetical protein